MGMLLSQLLNIRRGAKKPRAPRTKDNDSAGHATQKNPNRSTHYNKPEKEIVTFVVVSNWDRLEQAEIS